MMQSPRRGLHLCDACYRENAAYHGRAAYVPRRRRPCLADIEALKAEGLTVKAIAARLGYSIRQVYNLKAGGK